MAVGITMPKPPGVSGSAPKRRKQTRRKISNLDKSVGVRSLSGATPVVASAGPLPFNVAVTLSHTGRVI